MIGTWGTGGVRCKIKVSWDGAGREGAAFCYFETPRNRQRWVLVQWDDEDDPDCFKAAGLLVKQLGGRWEQAET